MFKFEPSIVPVIEKIKIFTNSGHGKWCMSCKYHINQVWFNLVQWHWQRKLNYHKTLYKTYVEHCGKIYSHKILGNTYVEHHGKIYLHKILRNMLYWTLWGDWFDKQITFNTLCWTLWEDLFTQNIETYLMLNTVGIFIYIKYWEIRYVEHCGKIYLHKMLGNI